MVLLSVGNVVTNPSPIFPFKGQDCIKTVIFSSSQNFRKTWHIHFSHKFTTQHERLRGLRIFPSDTEYKPRDILTFFLTVSISTITPYTQHHLPLHSQAKTKISLQNVLNERNKNKRRSKRFISLITVTTQYSSSDPPFHTI